MKRFYVTPETKVVEMKPSCMLCVSGEIGGDATEPAHAPEWSDDASLFGGLNIEWDE